MMEMNAIDLDHTRSAGDSKLYRVITLPSGLEVMLISSKLKSEARGETNTKAAAAISVQVGSFADPELAGESETRVDGFSC